MPELPEVETTQRGLAPHPHDQRVKQVIIRHPQLRWPVPDNLQALLSGKTILQLGGRAIYLLIGFEHGTLIMHLDMSARSAHAATQIVLEPY